MNRALITTLVLSTLVHVAFAQDMPVDVSDDTLIELYRGARVPDVVDGMVTVGLMDVDSLTLLLSIR